MELTDWYKRSFGKDYLKIYSHRDEAEAEEDVRGIIKITGAEKNWTILDLCCGNGRHLKAFHTMGYKKSLGLDLSFDLLKEGLEECPYITFLRGDMRNIPFKNNIDLVVSLFTSFGYFSSDHENLNVLKEVHKCLGRGGKFFLDYINRPYLLKNITPGDITFMGNKKIISKRSISSDGLRVEKEIKIIEGEKEKNYFESVRLFTLSELVELMDKAGFKEIKYYYGENGKILTETSPRVIFTGIK